MDAVCIAKAIHVKTMAIVQTDANKDTGRRIVTLHVLKIVKIGHVTTQLDFVLHVYRIGQEIYVIFVIPHITVLVVPKNAAIIACRKNAVDCMVHVHMDVYWVSTETCVIETVATVQQDVTDIREDVLETVQSENLENYVTTRAIRHVKMYV